MRLPTGRSRVSPATDWVRSCLLCCLFALVTGAAVRAASDPPQYEWTDVSRIVAIGDVHGSYDKLVSLLEGTGVVDKALEWNGGSTHLVFIGDLIDRGPQELEVLDLVRRLEEEAPAAGGQVHMLLGNHEVMNLVRDLRYVPAAGFRAFAAAENKKDRTKAWQRFRTGMASPTVPMGEVKAAFDQRFPPGYSGRIRAFSPDGEYGAWILQKPAVIKINGVVFLHGGLTDIVASLGMEVINRQVIDSIVEFVANMDKLEGSTAGPADFQGVYSTALALVEKGGSDARTEAARNLVRLYESLAFSPTGPLWYRGNSLENERLERASLDRALKALEARAIVVAHTPTGSGRITSRFKGQIYRADVGMAYGREPLALVIEAGDFEVFDPKVATLSKPTIEPPLGEGWSRFSEQLTDAQLEQFLRQAEVTSCTFIHQGLRSANICELEGDGPELRALFSRVDETPEPGQPAGTAFRTYRHEIAAYRLDRLLNLDLVPVTVGRSLEGTPGAIQVFHEGAVDIELLETYDQIHLLDGLEEEIVTAEIFSALLAVEDRHRIGRMFLPQDRRIALADSTKAFPTSVDPGPDLPAPCGPLDPELELGLRSLSQQKVSDALGSLLSPQQIDGLLLRRDRILEICDLPVPQSGE
ncbi:MAG: metallophosphoesterase [Thermoanaerobaculia bacterium]